MKHLWIPVALLALMIGCSENGSLDSTTDLTLQEQSEDAAVIAAEAVALNSGGFLESLEATLDMDVDSAGDGTPLVGKDRLSDEAVFDSSTCTWTIQHSRNADHGDAGFNWNQTRTLHFMDIDGECVIQRGDSLIRGLDFTRSFAGNSWNPRREGQKAGGGEWALRGLHDADPGVMVNGNHHEEGEGIVHRRRPGGETRDIVYSYDLALVGTDLLIIRRGDRRVPVSGTIHGVYNAVRNGREIHREFTIVFGEGGGTIDLGEDHSYPMNPVSGDVQF